MTVNRLYDTWFAWVCQLWPQQRITRQRNVALFLTGLFQGRSVQLQRVAARITQYRTRGVTFPLGTNK